MPESCIKIDEESSILSILTRRQAGGFHMLRYLGFAIVLLWLHPKVPSLWKPPTRARLKQCFFIREIFYILIKIYIP